MLFAGRENELETMTTIDRPGFARRVGVVGTGALGSEFCRLLMEAEHADVLLIDPDQLEDRNIATSALFRQAQARLGVAAGAAKVEVVRQMAEQRGLAWETIQAEIGDVGWGDLSRCDVLVCCADSVLARVETAGAARSLRLPMFEAAVASDGAAEGRVASFAADAEQACYLCSLSEHRRAEVLAYAISTSLGCLPEAGFPGMTGSEATLRTVAAELFRLFREPGDVESFALRLDTQTGTMERIALSHDPSCPWHELPEARKLISLPFDKPLSNVFQRAPEHAVVELFWPICLSARCTLCGTLVPERRRAALVRRRGVCSVCAAAGSLEPLHCVNFFRRGDPETDLTPHQLGLPDRHLYYWRPGAKGCERQTTYS